MCLLTNLTFGPRYWHTLLCECPCDLPSSEHSLCKFQERYTAYGSLTSSSNRLTRSRTNSADSIGGRTGSPRQPATRETPSMPAFKRVWMSFFAHYSTSARLCRNTVTFPIGSVRSAVTRRRSRRPPVLVRRHLFGC